MSKLPYCKFCGQLQGIDAPENATDEVLKEIGTQECSCCEAERYRKKMQQIAMAKLEIETLFTAKDETRGIKPVDNAVIELLTRAADLMGENSIHKISVGITGAGTANITVSSSGKISVQRSVQFKEKREVE